MILNSQSISNESGQTFNDYRYQKALKQISKLINVNRQIKIQSQKCRNEYDELQQKNTQLLQINSSLQQQNTMLRQQLQQLNINYCQLQQFCKKAQHEQKQLIKSNQLQSQQKIEIQQRHSAQIQQLQQHFRQQMNQMMMEINNKEKQVKQLQEKVQYVNQLQAENDKLHQRYQVALKQNDDLNKKCTQLNQKLINASTQIKHQPNEDLLNKLRINQQWIKSLNQENYNLKQKVFQQQYKKQRQKCNQTLLKNVKDTTTLINLSSTNANQVLIKQYLKKMQKKIKKTEEQKQKIQNKYNKLKTKNHQLQLKCNSMEKQINLLTIKLSGYEQLAQRQQRQIQQMIQQYHKQMDKVISNRKKIKSQHHLNTQESTIKEKQHLQQREKQLKTLVQNLQSQIIQNKAQTQQKDKLIKFLQMKIQSLQTQRAQLERSNIQTQQQLQQSQQYNIMDLDKTSKNYHKSQNLLRTHSLAKNVGKVFVINGKKYETQVLRSKNSIQSQQKQQQDSLDNNNVKISHEINKQGKKVIYPYGQLLYTSSERNYSTDPLVMSGQKV